MSQDKYNVVITSFLEPEYVERIAAVDPRFNVISRPDLMPEPRYAADHVGVARDLSDAQEDEWRELLGSADILFDFDYARRDDLPELAPKVRWIQSTSAGIGQFVKRMNYDTKMPDTVFTTASGAHARPLAEFVILSLLAHYKGYRRILEHQADHHWERYAGTDLEGRTMGIVGLGRIGRQVAAFARGMDMRVIGLDLGPDPGGADLYLPVSRLAEVLPQLDVLVLCVPHTPETENLVGGAQFAALPDGAFFVNIARGLVVDEPALIGALQSGKLSGAALDVFAEEPLPTGSPLWEMPNVIVSPHSASTSDRENKRITDLFCDNLGRFLAGETLRNVLDTEKLY